MSPSNEHEIFASQGTRPPWWQHGLIGGENNTRAANNFRPPFFDDVGIPTSEGFDYLEATRGDDWIYGADYREEPYFEQWVAAGGLPNDAWSFSGSVPGRRRGKISTLTYYSRMGSFASQAEMVAYLGMTIDGPTGPDAISESDLGIYRGSGFGLPGGQDGGWLVTFVHQQDRGFVVAYAVDQREDQDAMNRRSKRCLVLGGPWTQEQNSAALTPFSVGFGCEIGLS
jgi:hypothetical protein